VSNQQTVSSYQAELKLTWMKIGKFSQIRNKKTNKS
jgi:hypothetical protein